jgi:hypothetical protein
MRKKYQRVVQTPVVVEIAFQGRAAWHDAYAGAVTGTAVGNRDERDDRQTLSQISWLAARWTVQSASRSGTATVGLTIGLTRAIGEPLP